MTETVDDFTGSDGDESVYGLGSNDWLRGNGGRDLIDGGEGDDQVEGGSGNDRLFGGEGKDRLTGGSGADYMDGGNGDDEITISGFDRADGGAGRDLLYVGFGSANAVVDLAEGIAYAAGHGTARVFNFEWIESGNGSDVLFGNAADNRIRGNDGNDTIAGRGGNDDLDGGLGYDRLSGGDGDDVLRDGEDMTGGDGKDTFIIQMGEHHIIRDFEAGQDIVDLDTFGSTALNGSSKTCWPQPRSWMAACSCASTISSTATSTTPARSSSRTSPRDRRWRTSCCEVAGFRITEMKKAARMSGLLAC